MGLKAIVGGSIFDTKKGAWIANGVLVAKDGIIEAIAPGGDISVPSDAEVLSARGGYVIPGLIDAHNHLGIDGDEVRQLAEPDDQTMSRCLKNARLQLEDGVTTLRDMGEKSGLDFRLRELFASGKAPGPRLLCAGQWITTPNGHCAYPQMLVVKGVDQVRRVIKDTIAKGADHIKLMVSGGLSSPTTSPTGVYWTKEEIFAAVDEAHKGGKPIAAHCFGGPGLKYCIEAGLDTVEHGIFILDADEIDLVKQNNKILVYTTGFMTRGLRTDELATDWPPAIKERIAKSYGIAKESIRRTAAAGIRIAVGGDSIHLDHAIADEASMLVECGVSNLNALLAATKVGAEACLMSDRIGSLEVGKFADVLIVGEDPLKDIRALRKVRSVMKGGDVVVNKMEKRAF